MPQLTLSVDKDAYDKLPEPVRAYYTEDSESGGYKLDLDGYEDPSALKGSIRRLEGALEKERGASKVAKRLKALFPDADEDQIETLVKEAISKSKGKKGKREDDDDEDSIDAKVEKRLREKLEELNPKIEAGDKAQQELRAERLENRVRRAFTKKEVGILPEREEAAWKIIRTEGLVDLDEDGRSVIVKDEDGDPRSISLEDYLAKDFKKAYPYFFAGTQSSGSGSDHPTRGKGGQDMSKMSATDKIRAGFAQREGR